jgi:hypothetical protein
MRLVARSVSSRSRYGGRGVRRPRREAARVRAPAPTGTIARGDQALANGFRRSPCLTVDSAPCLSNEPRTHQGCELPAGARARRAGQGQRRARVFEATADVTQGTNAAFLSKVGERTPVFVRFSAVAGELGSAASARPARADMDARARRDRPLRLQPARLGRLCPPARSGADRVLLLRGSPRAAGR